MTIWVGEGDTWTLADSDVLAAFEAEYRRIYGLTIPDVAIEIVTWRLSVSAAADPVEPDPAPSGAGAEVHSVRPVVFGRAQAPIDTPVYKRATLGAGDRFDGPAIVEERETTAVIRPGWTVEVGPDGSLIATRSKSGGAS